MVPSIPTEKKSVQPIGYGGLAVLGVTMVLTANSLNDAFTYTGIETGKEVIKHMISLSQGTINMVNGIGVVSVATAIYGMFSKSRYDKLFEALNLVVKDKAAKVMKKTDTDRGYMLEVKMPAGLCMSDFERCKEEIEQNLNATVLFSFKKNLMIEIIKDELKSFYKFKHVHYDDPLKIAIGHTRKGLYELDIEQAPHIIVAGTTGGGKSVLLRAMLTQLIIDKTSDILSLHLVDFQRVELSIFKQSDRVAGFYYKQDDFKTLLLKMRSISEQRIEDFEKAGVVNIQRWNKKYPNKKLKYHVVVVDEFASLADKAYKDILQELKIRVAQDRKCGIHYILCTQRPSTDIISGSIKANIPLRICLKTSSEIDSRVVMDEGGAENLNGKGHAFVKDSELTEMQTMFLSDDDAKEMIKFTIQNKSDEAIVENITVSNRKPQMGVF